MEFNKLCYDETRHSIIYLASLLFVLRLLELRVKKVDPGRCIDLNLPNAAETESQSLNIESCLR